MWRVLCVDDDGEKAAQAAEYFTNWRTDNPFGTFQAEIETDFARATARLKNERFDLVTLDLHGKQDPDPLKVDINEAAQEGKRVLDDLKASRFVPVIFYSGYADKISSLQTSVVRVVKKGQNDLDDIRNAARSIYATGLPELIRHIEEEQRTYVWDTVDAHWPKLGDGSDPEELSYLLARRLAARFNRDSVKELLRHKIEAARPIELYIYPPIPGKVRTGCIHGPDERGTFWLVATPACDFAQDKVSQVLLVGAQLLTEEPRFMAWKDSPQWKGVGEAPNKAASAAYGKLSSLMRNNGGDRYWFLPATFFLPDLVVDFQVLKQLPIADFDSMNAICRLDSPYREEFMLKLSNYYGRMGVPDLEIAEIFKRI